MAAAAARGHKALEVKNYDEAIREFTAAIQESPGSPDYYTQRSIAYLRAEKLEEALADAEQAVINGQKRAKREAITEAQFRRGVVLYRLGRLGDAEFILNLVKERDEKLKSLSTWIAKTAMALRNLPQDDPKGKRTVTETPDQPTHNTSGSANDAPSSTTAATPLKVSVPTHTPADKIRYEWYQNTENIYFTLLAKGVPKDKAVVEIKERSLEVSFPIGTTDSSYQLHLEPLFAPVQPEKCITRVLPSKVEIILIKAEPGLKWYALESSEPVSPKVDSVADPESKADEAVKRAVFQEKQQGPVYPTSSKSGPKDWDKVAKELRVNDAKAGTQEEDDDDDERGGDEANYFFRKLYKGASPDAQRAMMKSFTESNGTALSTNWDEVSKGKVETSPPDSMEAKEYPK